MGIKKIILPFTIVFLFCGSALAQKRVSLGFASTYEYAKDEIVSESIFEGFNVSVNSLIEFNRTSQLALSLTHGLQISQNDGTWKSLKPQISYQKLVFTKFYERHTQNVGLSAHISGKWIDAKFEQSNSTVDGRNSGYLHSFIALNYQTDIKLGGKMNLSYNAGLPFLSYIIRPGYAVLDPDKTIGDNTNLWSITKSGDFRTILNQPTFFHSLSISDQISPILGYRFSYSYEYLTFGDLKRFNGIEQMVRLEFTWSF